MKKIIIIAFITFSASAVFAQNNQTPQQQKEREAWGNFLKAEQAKRDAQQAKIEADALKYKPAETKPVITAETKIATAVKQEVKITNVSEAKKADKSSTLYVRPDKK